MSRDSVVRIPVLSRVVEHTKQGWPPVSKKELEPFYTDGWMNLSYRTVTLRGALE